MPSHYFYSARVTSNRTRALDAAIDLLATDGLRALTHAPLEGQPMPLDQMLAAENQRQLRAALDELPEVHRHALQLRFTAELSYDEIATICQAPAGTVRSWVHHGLRKLRALLTDGTDSYRLAQATTGKGVRPLT